MADQWWTGDEEKIATPNAAYYTLERWRMVDAVIHGWEITADREWGAGRQHEWELDLRLPDLGKFAQAGPVVIARLPESADPPTRGQVAEAIRRWLAQVAETGARVLAELEKTDA